MLQEHENELKSQNEELYSIGDTECNSQNFSKCIDTDPYSYISDLIIQISKNITSRGLSQAGVNALFLSLLTGGLLYQYTVLPQTITGFLKLYIVPIVFLLYFIIDIMKNIAQINNLYMRMFKGSDFAYSAIVNESIGLYNLESCLQYKAFNSQQLIDIVKHLIKKNQFSPISQAKLMQNRALYEVKSLNYIKDLLFEFKFTAQAVCIFLEKMEMRLDYNYLDKLIEKYGESPSVLFSVGRYHKYKIAEPNSLCRIGYEFDHKTGLYNFVMNMKYISTIIVAILLIVNFSVWLTLLSEGADVKSQILDNDSIEGVKNDSVLTLNSLYRVYSFFILLIVSLIYLLVTMYLDEYFFKTTYKQDLGIYLSKKKDLDKNIIENIINDFHIK